MRCTSIIKGASSSAQTHRNQPATVNSEHHKLLPIKLSKVPKSFNMKVTFVLAALAAFAMAAPAENEESGAVAKGDFSALDNSQEFSLLDSEFIKDSKGF